MIKLSFFINREVFTITIKGKEIYYKDRKSKEIKLLPLDKKQEENLKKIGMENMFDDKAGEEQYENAKTEEELADIVIKDCQKKGVKLIRRKNDRNI